MKRIVQLSLVLFLTLLHALAAAQERFSVAATNVSSQKAAAYNFVLNLDQALSNTAEIQIDFPETFKTSLVLMADSRVVNGGFSVNVEDQTVIVQRTGLGDAIASGEEFDLKLATVINPADMQGERDFTIRFLENNNIVLESTFKSDISLLESNE